MIDLKTEIESFGTIDLEALADRESEIPDNIRNSLVLYNKAIESIKKGSEDIAIIGLKNAVSVNPDFHEAWNLLGLCYASIKEYDKAEEVFTRVIKAENNSIKAMRYLEEMNSAGTPAVPEPIKKKLIKPIVDNSSEQILDRYTPKKDEDGPPKRIRSQSTEKKIGNSIFGLLNEQKYRANRKRDIIISAVIFFIIGLGISMFLWPDVSEAEELVAQSQQAQQELNEEIAALKSENAELEDRIEALKGELMEAQNEAAYYKTSIKLEEAGRLAADKKYQEAADILLLMKVESFRADEKEKYDNLDKTVMEAAAEDAYQEGYGLYSNRKYQESLEKLARVRLYNESYNRMDRVYYYMGRCSQYLNDTKSAADFFQKVIDNYPNSSYARYSKNRLNEL